MRSLRGELARAVAVAMAAAREARDERDMAEWIADELVRQGWVRETAPQYYRRPKTARDEARRVV